MNRQEQIQSLLSKLKTASGDNYQAIESVATEILSYSRDLISDLNTEIESHKETTSESIKRKNKIKEISSKSAEYEAELAKVSELTSEKEQLQSSLETYKKRLSEYDSQVIEQYKSKHEHYKLSDSDHKKYFDLPENLDDLTVDQARNNLKELDKLVELKVFETSSTDSGNNGYKPPNNQAVNPKDIYSKSSY